MIQEISIDKLKIHPRHTRESMNWRTASGRRAYSRT